MALMLRDMPSRRRKELLPTGREGFRIGFGRRCRCEHGPGAGAGNHPDLSGRSASAKVRQAKEQLGQQRILVDKARRSIEQSVVQSWTQMEAAQATIQANRAQLAAANLALNGVVEERRVGQRTTLDVLNAQQSVLNAKEAISNSERNAIVASFSVLASTGKLTVDRLGLSVANYRPEVHYEATKDRWYGLRTVDGR
jgi:outer membrane protein